MTPTLTHLALHVRDLDACIAFYRDFCGMRCVHERVDGEGGRVVWLAEPGRVSLFEPIHGSAPKHAGKNVASPVAAILAGSMMLGYLGEKQAEQAIERVVVELVRSRRIVGVGTGDQPTDEVGELVTAELRKVGAGV